MAYIPLLNTIALEIPKAGSRSLHWAAQMVTGQTNPPASGHYDIADSIRRAQCENPHVVAIIRDPRQRLTSAINFHFRRSEHTAKSAIRLCIMNGPDFAAVFTRQSAYLNSDGFAHSLSLFPMERMQDALKAIGFRGKTPHRNAWPYAFPPEEIEAAPGFEQVLAWYDEDAELYDRLTAEN